LRVRVAVCFSVLVFFLITDVLEGEVPPMAAQTEEIKEILTDHEALAHVGRRGHNHRCVFGDGSVPYEKTEMHTFTPGRGKRPAIVRCTGRVARLIEFSVEFESDFPESAPIPAGLCRDLPIQCTKPIEQRVIHSDRSDR